MPLVFSDAPSQFYAVAWFELLAIAGVYVLLGLALRWKSFGVVKVTRYEPPSEISPAVAAFLIGNGRCERSFASALIALAAKGYLRVQQKADWFTLEKLRDADEGLPAEELKLLKLLFPGVCSGEFNSSDSGGLVESYSDFRTSISEVVTPELMSNHVLIWIAGIICSLMVLTSVVVEMSGIGNGLSPASIGFLVVLIILCGSCFVAALRVWPATLRKLMSLMSPSRRPRRPFNANDVIPILFTGAGMLGFVFLAVLTSTKFAALATAALILTFFSRYFLNAPTKAGRRVVNELLAFREFLSRTEADRLNHENLPGKTPVVLEPYMAYAVALGVERGWGEQFAGNLNEMLQLDRAYGTSVDLPTPTDASPTELNLFGRDK